MAKGEHLKNESRPKEIKGLRLIIFRIILIMFPLIILAFIELSLRIAGIGKEIPLFIEDPGNKEYLRINSNIARRYFLDPDAAPKVQYPEFRKVKSENTFRVVVQGASTVAGIPFKKGGAFPAMLEHRLKNSLPGKEVEVINTGITAVCSYTLLDLADEIAGIDPDAVVLYAGHNEYYGVLGVGSSQRLGRFSGLIRFYHKMNKLRLVRVIRKTHAAISGKKSADVISSPNKTLMERMVLEREIPFGSRLYKQGVDQFRTNISMLAGVYRKEEIPLFICTVASNIKDLEPFLSADADSISAESHFDQAEMYLGEELFDKAKKQFSIARDYDLLRFRAPSEFNEIIWKVAAEQDATVVDIKEVFEDNSPDGIIGEELLTEHVHPNIQGYFLISDACYNAIYQSGIVKDWEHVISSEAARKSLPVTEVDSIYGLIGIRVLKNSWPFTDQSLHKNQISNLFTAENFIDSLALDLFLDSVDWGEAMNRLYRYYIEGGQLEKALTVAHALQIEYKSTGVGYNMAGRIYTDLGQFDRATASLKKGFEIEPLPMIAYNLGNSILKAGKPSEAIPHFEHFIKSYPDRKDVVEKLEIIRRLDQLEEEIRLLPDSTELYVYAAYQYLLLDHRNIADSLIGVAYKQDPGNAMVMQLLY